MECILKNVDGRVYRVRPVTARPDEALRPKTKRTAAARIADARPAPEDEPSCAASAHLEELNLEELIAEGIDEREDGKFHCAWKIPSCLVRFVVGRGGQTRNGIQRDCKVELVISQKEDSRRRTELTVLADSANSVLSAKRRIHGIVSSAARNEDYTHFVSLPLPGAAPGVQAFSSSTLLRAADVPGLDPSVFVSSKQLHITLVMLRLLDEDAVMNAAALFRGLAAKAKEAFGPAPRNLDLAGLEYMNDDPSEVHVLYGKVTAGATSDAIRSFTTTVLIPELLAAGFIDDAELSRQRMLLPSGVVEPKLHVTLINTKLRRREPVVELAPAAGRPRLPAEEAMAEGDGGVFEEGTSKPDKTRQPIDVRALIASCDATVPIATASVDEVHLSARGRFAPGGYYRSVAVLRL